MFLVQRLPTRRIFARNSWEQTAVQVCQSQKTGVRWLKKKNAFEKANFALCVCVLEVLWEFLSASLALSLSLPLFFFTRLYTFTSDISAC